MTYHTPELLSVGSAQSLVQGESATTFVKDLGAGDCDPLKEDAGADALYQPESSW